MAKKYPTAFTIAHNGRANVLATPVGVAKPVPGSTRAEDKLILQAGAIWDTGATGSVITSSLAKKLGLRPIGTSTVTGVNKQSVVNVYLVDFYFNEKKVKIAARVTEAQSLSGDFEVLIGMDVIALGDFAVTNHNGRTKFTFCIPSTHDIDFVKEVNGNAADDKLMELSREQRRKEQRRLKKKGIIR
jgi:predicted aspartyl protease